MLSRIKNKAEKLEEVMRIMEENLERIGGKIKEETKEILVNENKPDPEKRILLNE